MSQIRFWFFSACVMLPASALAAFNIDAATPTNVPYKDIYDLIGRIFSVAITVSAIGFVILFLVGAISYLTSSGEPDGTKKAKATLSNAIIGLILVLAAWAIGNFILARLGYSNGGNTTINQGAGGTAGTDINQGTSGTAGGPTVNDVNNAVIPFNPNSNGVPQPTGTIKQATSGQAVLTNLPALATLLNQCGAVSQAHGVFGIERAQAANTCSASGHQLGVAIAECTPTTCPAVETKLAPLNAQAKTYLDQCANGQLLDLAGQQACLNQANQLMSSEANLLREIQATNTNTINQLK